MNKLYFAITYLQSSTNGLAHLYCDMGSGFIEADSNVTDFIKADVPQRYLFSIPNGNCHALRFDPIAAEGTITIANAEILNANGTVLQSISAQQFIPVQQIEIVKIENNTIQFTTPPKCDDPIFILSDVNIIGIQQSLVQDQAKPLIDLRQTIAKANTEAIIVAQRQRIKTEYQAYIDRNETLTTSDLEKIHNQIKSWPHQPLISVIMPTYNAPAAFLRAAIESVQQQLYPHWELCIADDASTAPHVKTIMQEYADNEPRIKLCFRPNNGHISAASNSALNLATGEYIALLDHDDRYAPQALYLIAGEINLHPETEWIYFDWDLINEDGARLGPNFKPEPNLDLFLSIAFMAGHAVYKTATVRAVGGFRLGYEGSQDHDLGLRMLDVVARPHIRHLPYILYHWRSCDGSVAKNGLVAKPYAASTGMRAVQDYLQRNHIRAGVTENYHVNGYRIHYALPEKWEPNNLHFTANPPLVSIIIPTRNRLELLQPCIASIIEKTSYPNYEIIIVDNDSDDTATIDYLHYLQYRKLARILRYSGTFNYSAINNFAVTQANGEVICLLNNDTEVINGNWLTEMVSHALRPEIGVVGARLWYENNTLQHGGVYCHNQNLGHIGHGQPRRACYVYTLALTTNPIAVTGACMVMRTQVFNAVGGLNERWLPVSYNDIDLCFKIRQAGYRILYTPHAELYHYESLSRGKPDTNDERKWKQYMLSRWTEMFQPDPLYRDERQPLPLRKWIKKYQLPNEKLLFLHIPRTAGVSFRTIVATEYPGTGLVTPVAKLVMECAEQHPPAIAVFKNYLANAQAVFGHFRFGLHQLLDLPTARYVTLLRDPIQRVISQYNHIMKQDEFSPVANIGAEILTLEKAVRSGIVPSNLMTKMLCGGRMEAVNWQEIETGPYAYGANFCGFGFPAQVWRGETDAVLKQPDVQPDNDSELLECAMKNMREHFLFVGLTENMAQAVAVLGQHLDWDDYAVMPEVNVNKNKKVAIIDDETRALIEEYNALDIQLYQFVQQLPDGYFLNSSYT